MYGILVYGSAAKTKLVKIEKAQRRILRAFFFMHRTDSLSEILTKEGVLIVFELFLVDLIKELFKQIRLESPSQLLDLEIIPENIHATRFRRKQLLPSIYCRTTLKRKSLTNSLRIEHNCLVELKLIPMNLKDLSAITVTNYIMTLTKLYIVDNEDLFNLCFLKMKLSNTHVWFSSSQT